MAFDLFKGFGNARIDDFPANDTNRSGNSTVPFKSTKTYIYLGLAGAAVLFLICAIVCCCRCLCKRRKRGNLNFPALSMKAWKFRKKVNDIDSSKIARNLNVDLGSLSAVIKYDKKSESIVISQIKCKSVPVRDASGFSYSYASAYLLPLHINNPVFFRTAPVKSTSSPCFEEDILVPVAHLEATNQKLVIELNDMNKNMKKDVIGQCVLRLYRFGTLSDRGTSINRKLLPYNPCLKVRLEAGYVIMDVYYNDITSDLTFTIAFLDIIPIKKKLGQPNIYLKVSTHGRLGKLIEEHKTTTINGTYRPHYKEILNFSCSKEMLQRVVIKIKAKHKKRVGRPIQLGTNKLTTSSTLLHSLLQKGSFNGMVVLFVKEHSS